MITKKTHGRWHAVVALVRDPARATKLINSGVQIIQGEVIKKMSMRGGMRGCDGVFYMPAWYKGGNKEHYAAQRINVEGTRHVLELIQELQIPKGVYTSTLAINSDTKGKIYDESFHSTSMAKRELGYQPRPLEEGLRQTLL